jgi:predicted nucleic acid-binding protein
VIVVDPSAAVALVLERGPEGEWAAGQMTNQDLHAPHLLDLEVASSLRRLARAGTITGRRGAQALEDLAELPVTRYGATLLLERIWELRSGLTSYGAAYVALAEALEAPLVTTDARLARAGGHRAEIVAYGD